MSLEVGQDANTQPVSVTGETGVMVGVGVSVGVAVGVGVSVGTGVEVGVGVSVGVGVGVANNSAGDEHARMEKINIKVTAHKLSLFIFFMLPSRKILHIIIRPAGIGYKIAGLSREPFPGSGRTHCWPRFSHPT
jgi:hypothetical protein